MPKGDINPIGLQKSLKGVDYPASKKDLQKRAKSNKAEPGVMEFLEQIPDREYETPAAVTKQINNGGDRGRGDAK